MIVATGATARQLGLESERQLQGKGVTYCATCDGAFFRDLEVIVVGGGDSAMEEAIFLTKFASKVTVVHRRSEFRASQIMLDRAAPTRRSSSSRPRSSRRCSGDDGKMRAVAAPRPRHGRHAGVEASGLFVAIGHDPTTALFLDQLDHDDAGYLVTKPGSTETNVPGVFAAGDVQDHTYRQAITAAGSGCMARARRRAMARGARGPSGTTCTPRPQRSSRGPRYRCPRWLRATAGSTCSTRRRGSSTRSSRGGPRPRARTAARAGPARRRPAPEARVARRLRLRRLPDPGRVHRGGPRLLPGGRPRDDARRARHGAQVAGRRPAAVATRRRRRTPAATTTTSR